MRKKITREEAELVVTEGAGKATGQDVETVVQKTGHIRGRFRRGPLKRFFQDVLLLLGLVHDYWKGAYRRVPFWTIGAIVTALLYVLNPLDLVPDFIPFFGQLDDAAVFGACLLLIEKDLRKYQEWKTSGAVLQK